MLVPYSESDAEAGSQVEDAASSCCEVQLATRPKVNRALLPEWNEVHSSLYDQRWCCVFCGDSIYCCFCPFWNSAHSIVWIMIQHGTPCSRPLCLSCYTEMDDTVLPLTKLV